MKTSLHDLQIIAAAIQYLTEVQIASTASCG